MNRPRNVLLAQADPREPVVCQFQHSLGALKYSLTIHQTPQEETWPGGALWDCGVLLSQFLLAVAGVDALTTVHSVLHVPAQDEKDGHLDASSVTTRSSSSGNNSSNNNKKKTNTRITTQLATRLQKWFQQPKANRDAAIWKDCIEPVLLRRPNLTVVELGCGVGLTGLVASIALGAVTTILTDLTVVIDQVTLPNVLQNTTPIVNAKSNEKGRRKARDSSSNGATGSSAKIPSKEYPCRSIQHFKGGGKVVAMPLCWGNAEEGDRVLQVLKQLHPQSTSSATTKGRGTNKGTKKATSTIDSHSNKSDSTSDGNNNIMCSTSSIYPDVILLGDVAYQHKPGTPSHFDILIESLQQLMSSAAAAAANDYNDKTQLLLFGTRLRMPASMDLLEMLQQHFTPLLQQPIPANILDPALQGVKHNMTLHIFSNKAPTRSTGLADNNTPSSPAGN